MDSSAVRLKKLVQVRLGTLNVGNGRGRTLADRMEWMNVGGVDLVCTGYLFDGERSERVRWILQVVLQ